MTLQEHVQGVIIDVQGRGLAMNPKTELIKSELNKLIGLNDRTITQCGVTYR